jgi:hypothetical protein
MCASIAGVRPQGSHGRHVDFHLRPPFALNPSVLTAEFVSEAPLFVSQCQKALCAPGRAQVSTPDQASNAPRLCSPSVALDRLDQRLKPQVNMLESTLPAGRNGFATAHDGCNS